MSFFLEKGRSLVINIENREKQYFMEFKKRMRKIDFVFIKYNCFAAIQ